MQPQSKRHFGRRQKRKLRKILVATCGIILLVLAAYAVDKMCSGSAPTSSVSAPTPTDDSVQFK